MLPAWATVALTLGGAAIGALAGLAVSYVQHRTKRGELTHAETEAWRATLVETTGAFIDAWHEFRWFLRARTMESPDALVFDLGAKQQLDPLGTRCAQTADKVMLVFGRNSPAGDAAKDVDERIWQVKKAVHDTRTPWNESTKVMIAGLLDTANDAHVEFVRKAHAACKPTRWREPELEGESPRAQ